MDISPQDFEPIRYQPPLPPPPPPPRQTGGWKPWMTALSVCCGVALIGLIAVISSVARFLSSEEVKEAFASLPRNAQHVGKTFSWRRIYDYQSEAYGYAYAVIGNFDKDQAPEILLLDSQAPSLLVDLSGSCRSVPIKAPSGKTYYQAWDWDGDGIDEVFRAPENDDPNIEIYNLNGDLVHTIKDRRSTGYSIVGDYDGDGKPDLLLKVADHYTACIQRQKGLGQIMGQTYYEGMPYCLADLDGDGKKEIVVVTNNNYFIVSTTGTQSPPWNIVKPMWAVDLSGQGIDWLVDLSTGILDPTTGEVTLLQWPTVAGLPVKSGYPAWYQFSDVAAFTPPGESEARLVVASTEFEPHLMLFNTAGELRYHQQFSDNILGMGVVPNDNGQVLLLVTATGILAYP